ncbi:MAG: DUF4397 domain-containing protein [Gemmatimonadaceae bacterium]
MRFVTSFLLLAFLAACSADSATMPNSTPAGFRLINGFTSSIEVRVDGTVAATGISAATIDTISAAVGTHTVTLQATDGNATTLQVTVGSSLGTLAAIRAGVALSTVALDDTNSIVPAGATKVRVLHLAPAAGEITVMRTQPDYGTPIQWQFPFLYTENISALGNPFYQSTPGMWEIRAWRKPSQDALGWNGTTARISFNLAGGEKRTVVVLDDPGGGVRLAVLE